MCLGLQGRCVTNAVHDFGYLLTMSASYFLDQWTFSHNLDQWFALVPLLVHIADITGGELSVQGYRDGVVYALEPLEMSSVSTSSLSRA